MKLVFKCGVLRLVVVMGEGWSGWGGVVVHLVCGRHTTVLHSPTGAPLGTASHGKNLLSPPHHCQFYDIC